jgi:hypothetical protein
MFKFKFFDAAGNPAPVESSVYGVQFKGNNVYLAGNNNLLTGSVYIGNTLNSGIEMSGKSSGYVMSVGYKGYTSASLGIGPGGFLMWSGSNNLVVGADTYRGVGLELIGENDEAHLIFDSFKNTFDVKAKSFFIGDTGSQFISGSNGQIEISSSNFHLTPNGDLIAQGTINANTGYFKNINVIGQPITANIGTTANDFIYTTASSTYSVQKFISIGASPVNTGSNINNNIVATASIYTSASITASLLRNVFADHVFSSSYVEWDGTGYPPYTGVIRYPVDFPLGIVTYYPKPGVYLPIPGIFDPPQVNASNGDVTGSFEVDEFGNNRYANLIFTRRAWELMWSSDDILNAVYGTNNTVAGPEIIDYLLTGSNTYSSKQTPVIRQAMIYARPNGAVAGDNNYVPFFITPEGTLIASSSISNIQPLETTPSVIDYYTVTSSLAWDRFSFGSNDMFFEIRSIITGSSVAALPIIGKRYDIGNIKYVIGGPNYTASMNTFNSNFIYYKDYTNIPDHSAPLQEFVRWNEKTDRFEEYSFTSSINVGGVNIAPYSGFLFISSSNAVVSSSQFVYGVNATNTSSADSVVFYNRKEYTPSGYGLSFTGTNYGTSSYGTQILGTATNVVNARGTININYLASSSTWDYIETDFIDISNYVQSSSLLAEAIKLQFALRWVDNFSDTANILARAQISSSGTILSDTSYTRYQGFPYGLQTYITVTFYDGEYKYSPNQNDLPIIGTKIVASDGNGSTNKWYVGDFFINPFIQRVDGTIPRRIKMRITWGAHPSSTLLPGDFATYYTAGASTGSFFLTGYPALGRYNGIALSEIRLMQAAKAEVVDFNEVKIGGTSISTLTTGSIDYQETNAAGLIPGDYRLALDGTYNITLGTSWKPWTSLYSENIYRTNEYSLSDREAKTSITATDLGLSFINKLEPVSYKWKKSDDDIKHYGLIAQDVASVLNGTGISIDGKTISYTELISPMIKAIQELSTKVKQLELEVSSSKH